MLHGEMILRVWDVEHGACAMLLHRIEHQRGLIAMIDSGCTQSWRPSEHLRASEGRTVLNYLFITNADQDHMSDLHRLKDEGIFVDTLYRNQSYSGSDIRRIKRLSGPLTADADWYASACDAYQAPTDRPFNDHMGGITCQVFANRYPEFQNTNDLSLVVLIQYAGFKILFPGDLEQAGWLAMLKRPDFVSAVCGIDVLIASHHGRRSGYCPELFDTCRPRAVVISDKPIMHQTQMTTPDYRNVVAPDGVYVRTTDKRRRVLTTRRDGWIEFTVRGDGSFHVDTECFG